MEHWTLSWTPFLSCPSYKAINYKITFSFLVETTCGILLMLDNRGGQQYFQLAKLTAMLKPGSGICRTSYVQSPQSNTLNLRYFNTLSMLRFMETKPMVNKLTVTIYSSLWTCSPAAFVNEGFRTFHWNQMLGNTVVVGTLLYWKGESLQRKINSQINSMKTAPSCAGGFAQSSHF